MLPSLKQALDEDHFWGPSYYEEFLSKSQRLASGIHEIMAQCTQLEALVRSRPTSPVRRNGLRRVVTEQVAGAGGPGAAAAAAALRRDSGTGTGGDADGKEMKLKKSRLAKRQSRLRLEERELLLRMAWQCWSVAAVPAEQRLAARDAAKRAKYGDLGRNHKRTLTCP